MKTIVPALIVFAVFAILLACLPEVWRHAALTSFAGAFIAGLVRALKRR